MLQVEWCILNCHSLLIVDLFLAFRLNVCRWLFVCPSSAAFTLPPYDLLSSRPSRSALLAAG